MIEMLPNYEQSGIYRVHSFHMGKLCELSTFIKLIDSAISFDNKFGPRRDKKVSEYDQEIPQPQTADNPEAPRGRAAQPSRDTRKTN